MSDPVKLKKDSLARWTALKSERSSWISHWRDISDNLLPRSGRYFQDDRNKGTKRHNSILDSTGTKALRVLAAGMMAGMTSPARPWFRLQTSDAELNKAPAVQQWLADVSRLMLEAFASGNTYRALHAGYEELGAFGTWSNIVLDDVETIIHHYPLTIGEYAIAADFRGVVDTVYREFQVTVGQMVGEFGRDRCSQTVRNLYDRGSLDAWVPIIHGIEPRRSRDPKKLNAQNMAWASCYIEPGSEREGGILRESGFKRFPALCARWNAVGGDIYGYSPGMDALGDIRQLQHQQLRKAQAIDYQVRPPVTVPTSMKHAEVDLLPGGVSYVDNPGQAGGVRSAYEVNLRLDYLLADMQDVRQRINGAFNADLFLMLANSTNSSMTATEVAERHEEKLLMLGPVLERLHGELLDPLIESTFDRLVAAGVVPPAPKELEDHELKVEFVSMLAQAQRAIGVNSMDRFVGAIGVVAGVKPEVLDRFDADQWAERYAERLGVDPELIVASDKVAVIRDQRAKAQAQAMQAAQAEQMAGAAQKLGTVSTGDGSADNMANSAVAAFSGYN
jgi:hypothetical protein